MLGFVTINSLFYIYSLIFLIVDIFTPAALTFSYYSFYISINYKYFSFNRLKAIFWKKNCHCVGLTVQLSHDICWEKKNCFCILSLLQTLVGLQGNCRLVHREYALCRHGNKTPPTSMFSTVFRQSCRVEAWFQGCVHIFKTELDVKIMVLGLSYLNFHRS